MLLRTPRARQFMLSSIPRTARARQMQSTIPFLIIVHDGKVNSSNHCTECKIGAATHQQDYGGGQWCSSALYGFKHALIIKYQQGEKEQSAKGGSHREIQRQNSEQRAVGHIVPGPSDPVKTRMCQGSSSHTPPRPLVARAIAHVWRRKPSPSPQPPVRRGFIGVQTSATRSTNFLLLKGHGSQTFVDERSDFLTGDAFIASRARLKPAEGDGAVGCRGVCTLLSRHRPNPKCRS